LLLPGDRLWKSFALSYIPCVADSSTVDSNEA
jgi:hypothetical protein